jgi:hypothetical protein
MPEDNQIVMLFAEVGATDNTYICPVDRSRMIFDEVAISGW